MNDFHLYKDGGEADLPALEPNPKLHDPALYVPSKGLMSAVNVALRLGQPLLVTGEPGTGKTQLAHHIAHFFKLGKPVVFNAQTTSTARDLFYRYDALAHFQHSQTQGKALTPEEIEQKFIRFQALGEAIRLGRRAVVLLDEIDKAPRDLPNDVLAALEDLRFDMPETGKSYAATPGNRPVIVMTSNSEKNLPDAFLRRVVYYHIPFPDAPALLRIVSAKVSGYAEDELSALIAHFEEIRAGKAVKMRKNPATAELVNWAGLLRDAGFPAAKLPNSDKLNTDERDFLLTSYSVLAKSKEDLKALAEWL
jgi:MoxR-like ATPase